MSTRLERWSRPADVPFAALVTALAIGLFAGSWGLLHEGFFTRHPVEDTPVYQRYGEEMVRGDVPYRDFKLEYPPAALPAFVIPAVGSPSQDTYESRFEWLMLLCGAAMIALMAAALSSLGAGSPRLAAALGFAGLAPIALGPVILTRFDLWPAALTVGALAALLSGRLRLGSGVLGLGFAAKLYPILLLPLALAFVWRRRGRREALVCAGAFAAVGVVCFLPFAAIAPGGLWHSVFEQGSRPLQLESLGSALLIAAHHVFGLGITMSSSHGSQNLGGSLPNAVAAIQALLQAAAVIAIWVWFARGEPGRERLVRASAMAVVAFIALGKVLSPQFLIWLIPLVPLVRGRRGLAASGLLALAFVLTQSWFPYRYWAFALHFDTAASWTVLVRDLALVGLFAVLVWPRPVER
ncbi:MAG TPA: glycosyltransferase 87 family protein [Gaiellaceae bacterium]